MPPTPHASADAASATGIAQREITTAHKLAYNDITTATTDIKSDNHIGEPTIINVKLSALTFFLGLIFSLIILDNGISATI